MGCWNATCGLTGLPIHSGDEVIALFIQDEAYGRIEGSRRDLTPSYPWTCFSPASLIVRGEYDDYGSVELSDAESAKMMLTEKAARSHSVDVAIPPKEEGGEVTYGFGMRTFDKSFSLDEGHRQDDKPFALWMAHASVFDKLVAETQIDSWSRECSETIYTSVLETVQKRLAENLSKMETGGAGSRFDEIWRSYSMMPGAACSYISQRFEMLPNYDKATKKISYEKPEIPADEAAMLVGAWGDLYALLLIQRELRMTMWPTGACGSQDSAYEVHRIRAQAAEAVIAAREEKQGEWDREYQDIEDDEDVETTDPAA